MSGGKFDRERLAKLLGMLGSSYDGEVVAAARQAERVRQDAGVTWAEILDAPQPDSRRAAADRDLNAFLRRLLTHPSLTDWERSFCRSLIGRRSRGLSEKQWRVVDTIVEKVEGWAT